MNFDTTTTIHLAQLAGAKLDHVHGLTVDGEPFGPVATGQFLAGEYAIRSTLQDCKILLEAASALAVSALSEAFADEVVGIVSRAENLPEGSMIDAAKQVQVQVMDAKRRYDAAIKEAKKTTSWA